MVPRPGTPTEPIATKVTLETLRRLDAAVDKLSLGSRRAALNAALAMWLDAVEAKGLGE